MIEPLSPICLSHPLSPTLQDLPPPPSRTPSSGRFFLLAAHFRPSRGPWWTEYEPLSSQDEKSVHGKEHAGREWRITASETVVMTRRTWLRQSTVIGNDRLKIDTSWRDGDMSQRQEANRWWIRFEIHARWGRVTHCSLLDMQAQIIFWNLKRTSRIKCSRQIYHEIYLTVWA